MPHTTGWSLSTFSKVFPLNYDSTTNTTERTLRREKHPLWVGNLHTLVNKCEPLNSDEVASLTEDLERFLLLPYVARNFPDQFNPELKSQAEKEYAKICYLHKWVLTPLAKNNQARVLCKLCINEKLQPLFTVGTDKSIVNDSAEYYRKTLSDPKRSEKLNEAQLLFIMIAYAMCINTVLDYTQGFVYKGEQVTKENLVSAAHSTVDEFIKLLIKKPETQNVAKMFVKLWPFLGYCDQRFSLENQAEFNRIKHLRTRPVRPIVP